MKKILLNCMLAGAAIVTPLASAAAAQTPPAVIVVINMDKVITESTAGRAAQAELQTRLTTIQARLQQLRTSFGTEEQTLASTRPAQTAPAATLSAWEAKAKDFQTRRAAADQEMAQSDKDLQASRQYALKQINDAVQPVITRLMKEHGASIALPENATIQHASNLEITDEVVAQLNKVLSRVSTVVPAGTAAQ